MLFGILIVFQVIVAIILVFLVMLQGGRGAELGAAFGGIGQAQTVRGTMSGIAKVTAVMGGLFMALSLSLAYLSSERADESVVKGIQAPAAAVSEEEAPPTDSSEPIAEEEASAEEAPPAPPLEQTDAPPLPSGQSSGN